MEKIIVHASFHAGHRQPGYPGKCRFIHGHTWRGTIQVSTDRFPRDAHEMSIDFGELKDILKRLDHRLLVTADDEILRLPEVCEPEGIVVLPGRGPSVEAVADYVWSEVVSVIQRRYPGRGLTYDITVTIHETDHNTFMVERSAVV
jgi:6-pyruvoyltetrahydropterin/6-carboxytetrahydropterin synthase